jgi:hypothetical protein
MRKLVLIALMAAAVATLAGTSALANCGHCGAKKEGSEHAWCEKCGETDKEKCCKDAVKCEKCGLHKDSPGCKHKCDTKTGA